MTQTRDYWAERFVQLEKSNHQEADKTMVLIDEAYRAAAREVERELSVWYQRFADNNGIVDMAEARRLLDAGQLKEFKWTVEQYIQHGRENGVTADWSKELENASARFHITRLDALKLNMQQQVEVLFGNQLDSVDHMMRQTYLGSYYHTAFTIQQGVGVGWDIAALNSHVLQLVVNRPWAADGRNFSQRIWGNKAVLVSQLQRNLTQSLLMENTADKTIDALMKRFNVSHSQAARLVYTENAYIQSVAQLNSYRENYVKQYQFVATLDDRTSDVCRAMDGGVYEVTDFVPGDTAPPLHPWCRSVTIPAYAQLAAVGQRAARDQGTGKTYYVPRDMTYDQWYQKAMNTGAPPTQNPLQSFYQFTSKVGKTLERSTIDKVPYNVLPRMLMEDEIIQRLGGGDMTKGSCASLGFAYAGNRAGLDVLDFRGGESQLFFSNMRNIKGIAALPGVDTHSAVDYNDIKAVKQLLKHVVQGKEYYLVTGQHAAVIRKVGGQYEYLELQSPRLNGWFPLDDTKLRYRFGCKQSHTVGGMKYASENLLVEIESLGQNPEFQQILVYINTEEKDQKKGGSGRVR